MKDVWEAQSKNCTPGMQLEMYKEEFHFWEWLTILDSLPAITVSSNSSL